MANSTLGLGSSDASKESIAFYSRRVLGRSAQMDSLTGREGSTIKRPRTSESIERTPIPAHAVPVRLLREYSSWS